MFACVSRRFITRLERVKLFPWNRHVLIRPSFVQCACLSTKNPLEGYQQRRNFPLSQFWKERSFTLQDYKQNFGFKEDRFENLLEEFLQKTEIQKSSVHFYYLMELRNPTSPWTVPDAISVWKLLSTCQMGIDNSERLRWIQYMKQQMEDQGSMTIECYNAMLKCYLNLNHRFDPVDVLTQLEEAGLKPNADIMVCLMKRYIFMRDIRAAKNIMDYVVEEGLQGSLTCSSLMIMGYTMMGMDAAAEEIAHSISANYPNYPEDKKKLRHFYRPMILGNALAGNVKRLRQLEIELLSIDNRQKAFFAQGIVMCSYQGAVKGAEFLIDAMGRGTSMFHSMITNPLCSLICNGHYELAFKWSMKLEDPSAHKFYTAAIRGQMPPKTVAKYAQLLQERNVRNSRFEDYLDILLRHSDCPITMKNCFPIMRDLGIVVRPNYLWITLLNIKADGKIQEVLDLLPYFKLDAVTEDRFLFPCLKGFKVTPTKLLEYIQEHGNLNQAECLYLQLMYAVYLRDKETITWICEQGIAMNQLPLSHKELQDSKFMIQLHTTEENLQKLFSPVPHRNNFTSERVTDGSYMGRSLSKGLKRHEPIQKATKLFQNGQDKDALRCLVNAYLEAKETGIEELFECKLFDMTVNEKNLDFAFEAMQILMKRGYLNTGGSENPSRRYQVKFATGIIRKFFEFVHKSEDEEKIISALRKFQSFGDLKCITIYTLLPLLIKNDKGDLLKEVLAFVIENGWFTDQISMSMSIGFFQIGRDDKAIDALQRSYLTTQSCIRLYNILASENQLEIMQKMYLQLSERFRIPNATPSKEILEYIRTCDGKTGEGGSGQNFYDLHMIDKSTDQETEPSYEKEDGSYI